MKFKKPLILLLMLCTICIAATLLFTACGGENGTPNGGNNSNKQNAPVSITLSETSVNMYVGETHQLYATVSPLDDNAKIAWTSLNTEVITVDNNGKITALSKGAGVVRAVTENNLVATCTINVAQAVGNLEVDVTYRAGSGAATIADTNAKIFLIPENLEHFPENFGLFTDRGNNAYSIFVGVADTSGKKTFSDIPVGTYRLILQSANQKYSSQKALDIMTMTEAGESTIKGVFGDILYQTLQELKNRQYGNSEYTEYKMSIASPLSYHYCYGETIEITNGSTKSVSYTFRSL